MIQLSQATNATVNANRNVTMFWCDKYGDNQNCAGKTNGALSVSKTADDPNLSPVTLAMGLRFLEYNYVVPISGNASVAKFWFSVNENDGSSPTVYNNGGSGYVIDQDQILFVPMSSHVDVVSNTTIAQTYTNRDATAYTRVYTLLAAVRDGVSPSRVYIDGTDVAVSGFPYPVINTVDLTLNSSIASLEGYSFYTGQMQDSGVQLTIDLHAVATAQTYTQTFMATTLLDNTPYVAPGTVTSTASTSNTASSATSLMVGAAHALLVAVVGGALLCVAL